MQTNIAAVEDWTAYDAAARFHDDTYRAMALVAHAAQSDVEDGKVAVTARDLAEGSARLAAQSLAIAARQLVTLGREPDVVVEQTLALLARAFAEVELEIRASIDGDVPLFI
jgi:hypothetical protein